MKWRISENMRWKPSVYKFTPSVGRVLPVTLKGTLEQSRIHFHEETENLENVILRFSRGNQIHL